MTRQPFMSAAAFHRFASTMRRMKAREAQAQHDRQQTFPSVDLGEADWGGRGGAKDTAGKPLTAP